MMKTVLKITHNALLQKHDIVDASDMGIQKIKADLVNTEVSDITIQPIIIFMLEI